MDGKVVISTALDNKGLEKGLANISSSFGGLKNVVAKIAGGIAAAFSVTKVIQFGVESSKAARQLSDALTGLKSIAEGSGRSFSEAQKFIEEYTADGLIPATNATAAYKNLLARGYDDSQIKSVMTALKDASAYGRQASYTMGEAVQSATEGLKNENSILVDNAGVTKNVAKMWEEYAASIGTTAAKLTQQQKIQAEVTGILKESKYQVGDAAKVAGTLSGQLQQLSFNFNNLKIAIGNSINPIVEAILPAINSAITGFTKLANSIASVMGALFGSASVSSSAVTGASAIADANSEIAESAKAGAEAQEDLAKGVGAAAKAAKKSLATFDELNVLQDQTAGGGGSGGASASGSSSEGTVDAVSEITDTLSPKLQAVTDKINELIAPLQEIDLMPLADAFSNLGESVKKFGQMISKHLEWFWFNVLAPLAEWTIEKAAPAAVNLLASAFELLGSVLDPVFSGLERFIEKMEPVIAWVQESAIIAVDDLTREFQELADLFGEKSDEIETIFSNLGQVISDVWTALEPVLTLLREEFRRIAETLTDDLFAKLSFLIDSIAGVSDILAGFTSENWDQVWKGMTKLAKGEAEYIEKRVGEMFEELGIDISGFSEAVEEAMDNVGQFFSDAWDFIESVWIEAESWFNREVVQPIINKFAPLKKWFSDLFGSIWQTIEDVFYNIEQVSTGCKTIVQTAWDEFWENLPIWANEAWEGIQDVFGITAQWFEDTFGDAWEGVKKVFSSGGKVFEGIKEGIVESFKSIVNSLISGINKVITKPFEHINSVIRRIRNFEVLGIYPFSGLSTVSVPQIPYLAQGAVLPANKPFMAVVGDQKHGTNVEAPLTTIQEAVANVMGDQVSAMMAGFNALLAENQLLRQVVENVNIGDTTIGQAADRYNQKLAIMRGG